MGAVLADFISPNPPEAQNLQSFYSPPTRIRWVDSQGRFHLRPFVYRLELRDLIEVKYEEQRDRTYPVVFFGKSWEYRFLGLIPTSRHLICGSPGGPLYLMGTDALGRDVFARVLVGARTSLLVVVLGFVFYGVLGLLIGGVSGTLGGWIDAFLMRFSEFVLALPALYIILGLRAVLPAQMTYMQTVMLTVGTIAAVTWPPMARGVRGLVLQLRSAYFIEAAHSLGGTPWYVFRRHMLPALLPFVLAQTALAAPTFILGEVMLSYLGVGLGDAGESWGAMLQSVRDPRVLTDFWWNLAPLLCIFITLLCLNLFLEGRRPRDLTRVVV